MLDAASIAGAAVGGVVGFVLLLLLWTQLVGWIPLCFSSCFARSWRCVQGPKGRPGSKALTYTCIVPGVWLGALPRSAAEVRAIVAECKLGGVVTLNQDWEMPGRGATTTVAEMAAEGLETCWLDTPDFAAVSLADLRRGAAFVHRIVSGGQQPGDQQQGSAGGPGRGVYVHCNGGRGRSTSVVLAYLIRHHNMDTLSAFLFTREKRQIANFLCCCRTRPQMRAIYDFERYERSRGAGDDPEPPPRRRRPGGGGGGSGGRRGKNRVAPAAVEVLPLPASEIVGGKLLEAAAS